MKKTNKGFSLVELIIVIAIMAILAGALAPALIKYINKSRLSTDVQTGQTIATAIQAALAVESAYDDACDASNKGPCELTGSSFSTEVMSALGKKVPKGKAKKTVNGSTMTNGTDKDFLINLKVTDNTIEVYRYKVDPDYMVYPVPGKEMTEKN